MSLMRFNFRSQALGRFVDVSITYPTSNYSYYDMRDGFRHHDAYAGAVRPQYCAGMTLQSVYLLHGGGDDDTAVYRFTNVERYAERNNVMLITPNVANSFGVNTNYGVEYSTFITEELPVVMQGLFASSPQREDNFIVGFAMGGNVALGAAIMRPDRYAACVDISGGIGLTLNTETLKEELRGDHFRTHFPLYNSTFGEAGEIDGSRHDLRGTAQANIDEGVLLPSFHLVAGGEEGSIGGRLKADADVLAAMGYDVNYRRVAGRRHDFDFWDESLALALDELLPLNRRRRRP